MIDTHLKLVADLDISISGSGRHEGRDVFVYCLKKELSGKSDGITKLNSYGHAYRKYSTEFGHYYRFLYRIISKIDEQVFVGRSKLESTGDLEREYFLLNYEVRYEYTSIVRSLLSDEELDMLFQNMLHFHDLKFKKLIERYCLLKNIPMGQAEINNEDYKFNPGAIIKEQNENLIELWKLKETV